MIVEEAPTARGPEHDVLPITREGGFYSCASGGLGHSLPAAVGVALAKRGCHVDITAFPVEDGEDAWPADEALVRYLDSGAPPERVSISSDAGGCLPCFDGAGRITHMDVGHSGSLLETLKALLARGVSLQQALPAFTCNPAGLLRLPRKGRVAVGMDADLVVLDAAGDVREVFAGGVAHVRAGAPVRRGMFEN